MHGKGHYTWKDGREYIGDYYEDKKHGYGIYKWVKLLKNYSYYNNYNILIL